MDGQRHLSKFFDRATDVLSGAFGAMVYHFITDKKEDGKVVVDKDGKPVKTLDLNKIRDHAPHFAKTMMDEAEFIALKNDLQPALLVGLEEWMGPAGPLGTHQRSDLILTIAEMTYRKDLDGDEGKNRQMARAAAFKALEQLAEEPDVASPVPAIRWAAKNTHAVAFRFMKPNETDYLGAQLTEQASQALVWLIGELHQAKTEWDAWANTQAHRTAAWTGNTRMYLRTRPRGFFATLRRMYDLPWQRTR